MAGLSMKLQGELLQCGASLADAKLATATSTECPVSQVKQATVSAKAAASQALPTQGSCKQTLTLSFFFDGTGNNMDADIGMRSHSNVARLFRAHQRDNESINLFRIYIPGIGTYFKEIGDRGGSVWGNGFGSMGKERLAWALKQFMLRLKAAEQMAANPSNKILGIKIAVFGFSRGAALARAFCRELFKLCRPAAGGGFQLKQGAYPIEVSFLGLFDTVASVGLPLATNNVVTRNINALSDVINRSLKWTSPAAFIGSALKTPELKRLAFGEGGVDPSAGVFDGHGSWATDLAIPPMVKQGLHLVAAHEVRNSFPVDSVLHDLTYPSGMREMIYPGAHSDIGGGYAPGEGARSPNEGELLSLIPLKVMYDSAVKAGVPLLSMTSARRIDELQDFAIDSKGAADFARLQADFKHYMNVVGWGAGHIGQCMLAQMRCYFKWRFYAISRGQQGKPTAEQETLQKNTQQQAAEKQKRDPLMKEKKEALWRARQQLNADELALQRARHASLVSGAPLNSRYEAKANQSRDHYAKKEDEYLREVAINDTAANDAALAKAIQKYDAQLLSDAKQILAWHKASPKEPIRVHYRALMEAYSDEFIHKKGLRDEVIIRFFDRYVHDSLSAFATDDTRTSDPRAVYIGDDEIFTHAALSPEGQLKKAQKKVKQKQDEVNISAGNQRGGGFSQSHTQKLKELEAARQNLAKAEKGL
ncbi:phospholipase effector Tle1 domain-containing protein [Iodobacter arcticus]|uniref:Phospholipase effector Tle1 domain-containing protein n=1 Tax=Iodobacter arcticus TaxID=590593 RepID=A0ABW2QVV9_9NEIS